MAIEYPARGACQTSTVPNVLRIAHRMPGSRSLCATLLAAGANMFEVDVQFSRTGIVVSHYLPFAWSRGWLYHDNWRLRRAAVDGRDPALATLLDAVPPETPILLDPKDPVRERRAALIEAIIDTLADRDRFVISTGGTADLARLRAAGFRVWLSIGDTAGLRRASTAAELPVDGVSVRHTLLDQAEVEALHGRVGTVVAWTVNSRARARSLRAAGVDGITTDRAAVLRSLAGQGRGADTG